MIEGLWVIRFQGPGYEGFDLNGGVVVIESGRVLGGDSGYYYLGDISPTAAGMWRAD